MPRYEFNKPRLYIDAPMQTEAVLPLNREQAGYLLKVLRLAGGAQILAFNGRDGEWLAAVEVEGRKSASLVLLEQVRRQTQPADLHYLFAPLKHARLDYMVQKATEMGASVLVPVMTRRTQAARVNIERMHANVIEAAEQCGILAIPEVRAPVTLERLLAEWPAGRALIFCDEDAPVGDPVENLRSAFARQFRSEDAVASLALLIGPEGGFDEAERAALRAVPQTTTIALGPRILRADTAAVAALAVIQAAVGDWRD